jgi:DNA-binding response OmpR family regulator
MLIVEDDISTRKVMHQIFAHRGWEVRPAASVAEALSELSHAPDCAIIDLMLPNGAGEQILEFLHAGKATTRILVVSAVIDADRINGVADRFKPAAILLKPVNLEQMMRVVEPHKLSNSSAHRLAPALGSSV